MAKNSLEKEDFNLLKKRKKKLSEWQDDIELAAKTHR